jgi:sulfur-oxidizing protein SoxZ
MGDPMRIRAQLKDGTTDLRILMGHPMETGQRKDASGKPIPAHYINDVKITVDGRTVLAAKWGTAIAQNPFLQIRVQGAKSGDKVVVAWVDNLGDRRTDEATIA